VPWSVQVLVLFDACAPNLGLILFLCLYLHCICTCSERERDASGRRADRDRAAGAGSSSLSAFVSAMKEVRRLKEGTHPGLLHSCDATVVS
jgi:hypothetical protein